MHAVAYCGVLVCVILCCCVLLFPGILLFVYSEFYAYLLYFVLRHHESILLHTKGSVDQVVEMRIMSIQLWQQSFKLFLLSIQRNLFVWVIFVGFTM